jgi:hypothetical protein
MVVNVLRFMLWNVLMLLRWPVRAFATVMSLFSLGMVTVGIVALPFGGLGEAPLWGQLIVVVLSGVFFLFWSALAYCYDSLIFRLTPEDREIFLQG